MEIEMEGYGTFTATENAAAEIARVRNGRRIHDLSRAEIRRLIKSVTGEDRCFGLTSIRMMRLAVQLIVESGV